MNLFSLWAASADMWLFKPGAMKKREKICILPKLYNFGGDLSKKWYVYFSVKDPKSGKMITQKVYNGLFKVKTFSGRMKIAEKLIGEYAELLKNGYNPLLDDTKAIYTDNLQYFHAARVYRERKLNNKTFNYFANEYLRIETSGLETASISTYKSKIRTFNSWLILKQYHEVDISAINNYIIIEFFTYLNNERKSSASTYRKYKNLITDIFEFAINRKAINTNPVSRLPRCLRVTDKAPKPINSKDVIEFIDKIINYPQLYLFIMFEYYCFMRPGEIRLMQISWIDWGNGVIRIPKNMNKTKITKTPIIPNVFMQILRNDYKLHELPKTWYVIGKDKCPGLSVTGKNTMRNRFNVIRKELHMPIDYMLYSWKHTGNGRLEKAGASPYERKGQNGHTTISTTERYSNDKFGFESQLIREGFPELGSKI